ncbi:Uncharacterized protein TPAR_06646 [Tolypocladium paradoxum]|uniref:GIY-YIG domain-containing protein n=1 Tax=Tolypocladium paradoxum TaxID=94208 RepID=A0A2S4KSG6_9HYPO|nr:Uncharacterized protein TPAR_06646 [Tolypocladium paradoxum]
MDEPAQDSTQACFARERCRQSSVHEAYSQLFESNTRDELRHIFQTQCDQAWSLLVETQAIRDVNAVSRLLDARQVVGKECYLGVLRDTNDHEYLRLYVGQSNNVGKRVREHITSINNPNREKLLYTFAREQNRTAEFFLLGTSDESSIESQYADQWLNLGEQFWVVMLQTQPTSLDQWVPASIPRAAAVGLNVSMPIHQNHDNKVMMGFGQLFSSADISPRK